MDHAKVVLTFQQYENLLGSTIVRIKHYRRVATRYEKTDTNYLGLLCLAALLTTTI